MEIQKIEMEFCQGVIDYHAVWKDLGNAPEFSVSTIKQKIWDIKLQINESKENREYGEKTCIKVKECSIC